MKKTGNISLIVFGTIFTILCLFGYLRGTATENWPAVNGESLSLHLEKETGFFRKREHGTAQPIEHEVHITYKYSVNGQEYISNAYKINFLGFKSNLTGSLQYLEDVLDLRQKYSPGTPVEVYYDQDNPSDALLVKGYQGFIPTYLAFSLLAIGFGIYGLFKN